MVTHCWMPCWKNLCRCSLKPTASHMTSWSPYITQSPGISVVMGSLPSRARGLYVKIVMLAVSHLRSLHIGRGTLYSGWPPSDAKTIHAISLIEWTCYTWVRDGLACDCITFVSKYWCGYAALAMLELWGMNKQRDWQPWQTSPQVCMLLWPCWSCEEWTGKETGNHGRPHHKSVCCTGHAGVVRNEQAKRLATMADLTTSLYAALAMLELWGMNRQRDWQPWQISQVCMLPWPCWSCEEWTSKETGNHCRPHHKSVCCPGHAGVVRNEQAKRLATMADLTTSLQPGKDRSAVRKSVDKPGQYSKDHLEEGGMKKGSGHHPTVWGWEQSVFNQTNIGMASRATLGELLRDRAECV